MMRNTLERVLAQTLRSYSASGPKFISTNRRQQNTAATTAEASQSDKFLHYSHSEGYYKTSPQDPVAVPNIPLDKYVWKNFKKWENYVATVCVVTGRQYTYAQLRDASAALAVRLQTKFKLGKGDVLAICLPNLPEFPLAALAAIEAGLTVTTVNPIYTAEEIARQLTFSNAKFLIGNAASYNNLVEACKMANKNVPIAVIRTQSNELLPAGAIDFFEIIKTNGVDFSDLRQYETHPDDLCVLPFSSGTTGLPKGVKLSHNNISVNCEQIRSLIEINTLAHQECLPGILPFFHIYGLTVILLSKLAQGCKIVSMPQFKPDDYMKILSEHNASILNLVPPIVLLMINHPKFTPEKAPNVHLIMSGAAPISTSDVDRLLAKFPNVKFVQGYGMTETSPCTVVSPLDTTRYGSIGLLVPNTEAKIVPLDSLDFKGVGPNKNGELCLRGPQVMSGYLNNEQANEEAFYADRWLRTGDVAYYDDEGFFYITDRMKELIKVKGFQVPPAELEAVLRDHGKILDAAVFGVPHEFNGEAPKAVVVLKPGEHATEEEIYNYVAERVAEYKKLEAGVVFVDEIPKNTTGKIMRKALKEKYSS